MEPKRDTVGRILFGFCIFFCLMCIAVVATGCIAPKLYECEIYRIEGIFLTNKLHNRHGVVELWRYDSNGKKRTFMWHKDRLINCKELL